MGRPIRFVPEGHVVETTLRTIQGRLLLQPTPENTCLIAGVIGRAQRLYDMEIHAVSVMGNHLHFLLSPREAHQLARFMGHIGSNIARKIGARVGWRERFWGRRYRAIVVSNEPEAQVARLRYLLAHGAKEGFVIDPIDWPGVHAAKPLTNGTLAIPGTWFDGSGAYRDRLAGRERPPAAYGEAETIHLSPLPCWQHLPAEEQRDNVMALLDSIQQEASAQYVADGKRPAGTSALHAQHPHTMPRTTKRTPAPAFHAASRSARQQLWAAYSAFVVAYRIAAENLRRGVWPVHFPKGCFPPAQPFVPG